MNFNIDIDKTVEASLYILGKVQSCDMHKLFKILYFAESEHLAQYGRPITGDEYIAMEFGPVPSLLKDVIKSVSRPNPYLKINIDAKQYFDVMKYFVGAKRQCNTDFLSESDIECIEKAIGFIGSSSFDQRTKVSHNSAWENAKNSNYSGEINPLDMASSAGASFDMLKYIQSNIENQSSFVCR